MKIVIDDKIPFIRGVLEPFAETAYVRGSVLTRAEAVDADALIVRTRTQCNEALLKGTRVRFIATATIGFDHIDTQWCRANGIAWANASGCNAGSVRQYIAAALCALAVHHGFSFGEVTLGVVGAGNVGGKVARLGETLGMKVLVNDPPRARREGAGNFVSLEEIVRRCDIVTLHVPLNRQGEDKTLHLFDEAMLRRMNANAILINTSRGEVTDNCALKNALKTKALKAAVLDVWENEPDISRELIPLLDVATPHIAGYSADGKAAGTAMSVQALSRFFGLPLAEWRPGSLPAPEQSLRFRLDGEGKTEQQRLAEAILHAFPIEEDDRRLRRSPETFERQRGEYPVRREFEAYSLQAENMPPETERRLRELGFNISKQ